MRNLLTVLAGLALLASTATADLLYSESFEYGDTTTNIQDVSDWDTGSGVVMYDHDGGLDSLQLGGEAGGSMFHDHDEGNRGGPLAIPAIDPFTGKAAGTEVWFAGLIEVVNLSGTSRILFDNSSGVNDIGFGIEGDGDIVLYAASGGGAATYLDTDLDATTPGQYLFIVRGTKGTGTSPTDSTVDIWVNPGDTSSVAALGDADLTSAACKFGRDGFAYDSLSAHVSYQGRIDEIRMGDSLGDVVVPEPATMALLGLGGLGVLTRRRR